MLEGCDTRVPLYVPAFVVHRWSLSQVSLLSNSRWYLGDHVNTPPSWPLDILADVTFTTKLVNSPSLENATDWGPIPDALATQEDRTGLLSTWGLLVLLIAASFLSISRSSLYLWNNVFCNCCGSFLLTDAKKEISVKHQVPATCSCWMLTDIGLSLVSFWFSLL